MGVRNNEMPSTQKRTQHNGEYKHRPSVEYTHPVNEDLRSIRTVDTTFKLNLHTRSLICF